MQTIFTGGKTFGSDIKQLTVFHWKLKVSELFGDGMSGGKNVATVHFFGCFRLCCFQTLKRLRAFRRQWICSLIPIFLFLGDLLQPYQNGAPSVLLRKRHQHSRLIIAARSRLCNQELGQFHCSCLVLRWSNENVGGIFEARLTVLRFDRVEGDHQQTDKIGKRKQIHCLRKGTQAF